MKQELNRKYLSGYAGKGKHPGKLLSVSIRAFTLLELLVVLGIIGMLTAIGLPFMKGINRSNTMAAATRQLLDDLEYARNRAISGRTTVYVVFIPPVDALVEPNTLTGVQRTNILTGQQTSYALFTRRIVGEQPGVNNELYLTKWYSLPQGIFIPRYKFFGPEIDDVRLFTNYSKIPIPSVQANYRPQQMPYVAFDYQGRLCFPDGKLTMRDEVIPLAQGSVFYERDPSSGELTWAAADARENPPNNSINNYNRIRIDWLTGRARVERLEIPK